MKMIGKSIDKVDALAKVTGAAQYAGDISMPGMLYGKTVFAEIPHAKILRLDTTRARELPGVVAILTARDIPVNEYGLQIKDQPVFCGPGSSKPDAEIVRFIGDQVAFVVAESEQIAEKAAELIEINFEELPIVSDAHSALLPDAPLVHPELGDTNICVHDRIRKGDIAQGFAQADIIIEGEYELPIQEHAYLEPEAGLAYIDDEGRVAVICAGQWTHEDREQIAHALDLPLEKVRVIYAKIGGAFGGREDMSVQIILAMAAWVTKKPVKTVWSRRESFIGHGKRHPMKAYARWGATKDGILTAAEMKFIADAGAYMYTSNKVLGNTTIVCTGPYAIPNVKVDSLGVYTNNIPSAAFRGFGAPQGIFAAELQMNKLAQALQMDPVELRMRNALKPGDTLDVGTPPIDRISAREVIEAAAVKAGWKKGRKQWVSPPKKSPSSQNKVRGIGFSAGFKNVGFSFGYQENSWAKIELHGKSKIEKAVLYQAGSDVGQGAHTAMTQMAAHALNIPSEKIEFVFSDTATSESSGSCSASRLTFMSGNAIIGAAQSALEKWKNGERPAIGEYTYLAPKTTPFDPETGYSMPNFCYAYTAQAVEVEVDLNYGNVRIIRVVSANDVGKIINPRMTKGQIEGGILQAMGYTLLENYIVKNGKPLTDSFSTYLIPTIMDIPETIEPVILELPDPNGPWGARGVGELPFLPLAPAVISAIHDAAGVWIDKIPATAETVLSFLEKQNKL